MSVVTPPPYFHPIHTLVVYEVDQLEGLKEPPEWPNLRKVIVDRSWDRVSREKRVHSLESRPDVRVEDRDGLTVEEFEKNKKAKEAVTESVHEKSDAAD
jgi:hypothetical protein